MWVKEIGPVWKTRARGKKGEGKKGKKEIKKGGKNTVTGKKRKIKCKGGLRVNERKGGLKK